MVAVDADAGEGELMPYDEVMGKWKSGELHSGSKSGPKVKNQKQAVAIMLSEKRAAAGGKTEYSASKSGLRNAAK